MGLLGILLGLGLLIWLSYRGWSVLLLAPVAALRAAACPLEAIAQFLIGASTNSAGENYSLKAS